MLMNKEEYLKELEKRVGTKGLLRYANNYFQAYKIIKEQKPRDLDLLEVKFFLLCHSLELGIKAYLRTKLPRIKLIELGHDLEALLVEAYQRRGIVMGRRDLAIIRYANDLYKTKQFEYSQKGYKEIPSVNSLEDVVERLLGKIYFLIKGKKSA